MAIVQWKTADTNLFMLQTHYNAGLKACAHIHTHKMHKIKNKKR